MSTRSVAIVTELLPAYRYGVMERLAERGLRIINLVAGPAIPHPPPTTEPGYVGWSVRHLPAKRVGWRRGLRTAIKAIGPDVILLEHGARLDFTWSILLDPWCRTPRMLWTHGIERRERNGRRVTIASLGRWIQLHLADGVLCYDEDTANTLREVFPRKIIGVARNTNDRRSLSLEVSRVRRLTRASHRLSLGLKARPYIVTLGRLVPEKAFHRVPGIVRLVRSQGVDVGVIFIGDGPGRRDVQRACAGAGLQIGEDAVLVGEVIDERELAGWMCAADLCVNPGPLGLSVVDCGFSGVPVVSSRPGVKGPHHGPEWRYLVPGVTGYLAERDTDESLARLIVDYFRRDELDRRATEERCIEVAHSRLGITEMIDGIVDACEALLQKRRVECRLPTQS